MENINKEIENLIYSFFTEMNKWEKYCYEVDNNTELSFEDKRLKQKEEVKIIVDKFLTKKERKMGLPDNISYGHEGSYTYNPDEEKIVDIEVDNKKAIITTQREKPLNEQNQYILKNTKNGWRIDYKKRFSSWKKKWENAIL